MPGAFTIFSEFLCKQTSWMTEMYCPGTVLSLDRLWSSKAGGWVSPAGTAQGAPLVYRVPIRTSGESKVWPTETLAGHWLTDWPRHMPVTLQIQLATDHSNNRLRFSSYQLASTRRIWASPTGRAGAGEQRQAARRSVSVRETQNNLSVVTTPADLLQWRRRLWRSGGRRYTLRCDITGYDNGCTGRRSNNMLTIDNSSSETTLNS